MTFSGSLLLTLVLVCLFTFLWVKFIKGERDLVNSGLYANNATVNHKKKKTSKPRVLVSTFDIDTDVLCSVVEYKSIKEAYLATKPDMPTSSFYRALRHGARTMVLTTDKHEIEYIVIS